MLRTAGTAFVRSQRKLHVENLTRYQPGTGGLKRSICNAFGLMRSDYTGKHRNRIRVSVETCAAIGVAVIRRWIADDVRRKARREFSTDKWYTTVDGNRRARRILPRRRLSPRLSLGAAGRLYDSLPQRRFRRQQILRHLNMRNIKPAGDFVEAELLAIFRAITLSHAAREAQEGRAKYFRTPPDSCDAPACGRMIQPIQLRWQAASFPIR